VVGCGILWLSGGAGAFANVVSEGTDSLVWCTVADVRGRPGQAARRMVSSAPNSAL